MKLTGKQLQAMLNTPLQCKICHTMLNARKDGYYVCPRCENVYKDNVAIVKEYIYNNPDTTIEELLEGTKLSEEILNYLIENDYITLPDNNKNFSVCRSCGRMILKGHYCNDCTLNTLNKIKNFKP